MRLTFNTKAEAQAVADRIFKDMAVDLEPGTTAWAIPYQDRNKDGTPLNTQWHVGVDERCRSVLTEAEVAQVQEWVAKEPL